MQLQWLEVVDGQGVGRVYGSVMVDAESYDGEDVEEIPAVAESEERGMRGSCC